ncbi:MAG: (deoxy)nucleoside triphosphate pyrophosphohydrolase [Treponema sp.]|jgi:8-oxo-dGTP diphosphatase|nr:(deoxy)nucleoside triphosphate pyrophosphohydrolase [Treponema sp.]
MKGRRSVAGIAIEGGRFFIAQRLPGGDLGCKWEFPGGKVEEGETDAEALIREYREELGVSVRVGPLLASAVFQHHGLERTLNAYRIYFSADSFALSEHTRWRWASFEEIQALDFADSDRRLLPQLAACFASDISPVPQSGC